MYYFYADASKNALREHLMEEVEYNLLSKSAWDNLCSWYGMIDEQQPIARVVREHGLYVKDLKVEVYLTELKLCMNTDVEDFIVKRFSKTATLGERSLLFYLLEGYNSRTVALFSSSINCWQLLENSLWSSQNPNRNNKLKKTQANSLMI